MAVDSRYVPSTEVDPDRMCANGGTVDRRYVPCTARNDLRRLLRAVNGKLRRSTAVRAVNGRSENAT